MKAWISFSSSLCGKQGLGNKSKQGFKIKLTGLFKECFCESNLETFRKQKHSTWIQNPRFVCIDHLHLDFLHCGLLNLNFVMSKKTRSQGSKSKVGLNLSEDCVAIISWHDGTTSSFR